jgi:cytochrome c oxidase cbb3-type subunit III
MDFRAVARSAAPLALLALAACKVDRQRVRSARAVDSGSVIVARNDGRIYPGGVAPPAEMVVPAMATSASAAAAGAKLFTGMNCDGCHGGGAVGAVGPSLTDGRWRYGGADADIFRSIAEGRPKGMPAFGGVLQPAAIWQLVTYLKSLPTPHDVSTERW